MSGVVDRPAQRWRDSLPRRVHLLGWASLVANTGIVATGGAVRLTASGLGCPEWPRCTPESWVNTAEMGIHGIIEFGNRLLTFVLVVVAAACFLAVRRYKDTRPELFWMAFAVGIGIIIQAGVGGTTVLLDLEPNVVGVHYMLSAVLVAITATFVYRAKYGPRSTDPPHRLLRPVTIVLVVLTVAAIYLGTLTTGAGPHAGDDAAVRNGLDPAFIQHLHSWPGYLMVAVTVVLFVLARQVGHGRMARYVALLLLLEAVQVLVGIIQSRNGLPVGLVGIHMVLACIIVATLVFTWHSLRPPVPAEDPAALPDSDGGSADTTDRPGRDHLSTT